MRLNNLMDHPRFWELIDLRKNVSAYDSRYQYRTTNKRYIDAYNDVYSGAIYEYNYNFDFELTKQDIRNFKAGKITDDLLNKIENDLGVLDNNPLYFIEQEIIDYDIDVPVHRDIDFLNMFPLLIDDLSDICTRYVYLVLFMFVIVIRSSVEFVEQFIARNITTLNIYLQWSKRIKPKKSIVGQSDPVFLV